MKRNVFHSERLPHAASSTAGPIRTSSPHSEKPPRPAGGLIGLFAASTLMAVWAGPPSTISNSAIEVLPAPTTAAARCRQINEQSKNIDAALQAADASNQAATKEKIQHYKQEALRTLQGNLARYKREYASNVSICARDWFDGDVSAGKALADINIRLYEEAIATHFDATTGNEIRDYVGGFALPRAWEAMQDDETIRKWLAARGLADPAAHQRHIARSARMMASHSLR